MLVLYSGGGSGDFELQGQALDETVQDTLFFNVSQLLVSRGETEAANYLASLDFSLSDAINHFHDEFYVLCTTVPLAQYEYLRQAQEQKELGSTFTRIAETITESGYYVRFIAVYLDKSSPPDDWRTQISGAITLPNTNQAVFSFPGSTKIQHEGLNFRSKTETKLFDALVKRGLLVLPLPVAVMGRRRYYREPDFVACYQGKVGVLEIHGDKWHPPATAAQEHERRREFTKLGVSVYEIFGADRCWNDPEGVVDDFLQAFV